MKGPDIAVTRAVVSLTSVHIVPDSHQYGTRAACGLGTSQPAFTSCTQVLWWRGQWEMQAWFGAGQAREGQEVLQRLVNIFFHREKYSSSGDHICFFCPLPCFAPRYEREFTCHIIHPFKVYHYESWIHRAVRVAAQSAWEHFQH